MFSCQQYIWGKAFYLELPMNFWSHFPEEMSSHWHKLLFLIPLHPGIPVVSSSAEGPACLSLNLT